MVSLPTNARYPESDPIGAALWWAPEEGQGQDRRPALPALSPYASEADKAFYGRIKEVYDAALRGPYTTDQFEYGLGPGLVSDVQFGELGRPEYLDPNLRNFVQSQRYNASLKDSWSPFGDEFAIALMGLGGAVGAAGAFGGFGAAGAGLGATEAGIGAADVVSPITAGAGASIAATPTTLAPELLAAGAAGAAGVGGGAAAAGGAGGTGTTAATGGGVLGTGLTAAQAIKLGIPLASVIATMANGGGGGTEVGGDVAVLPGQEELFKQFRQMGLSTIPERAALMSENLRGETARMNASPHAMMQRVGPQVQAIREKLQNAFKAASRTLGPSGGGQIERAERDALRQGGSALQALMAAEPGSGLSDLLSTTAKFRPTMLAELPHPTTVNTSVPNQFGDLPGAVRGYSNLSRLVDRYMAPPQAPASQGQTPTSQGYASPIGPTLNEEAPWLS